MKLADKIIIVLFIFLLLFSTDTVAYEPAPFELDNFAEPAHLYEGDGKFFTLVNEAAKMIAVGDTMEAEGLLGQAIVINQQSPEAFYNFGLALGYNEKFDDAIKAQLKAVELKPQFPEAYLALGNLYLTIGEDELALNAYKQARYMSPGPFVTRTALFNKGVVLGRLGRFLEAEMALSKCLVMDPEESAVAFQIAVLNYRSENYKMALGWLESVKADYRFESEVLKARIFIALNDASAAAKSLVNAENLLKRAENIQEDIKHDLKRLLNNISRQIDLL